MGKDQSYILENLFSTKIKKKEFEANLRFFDSKGFNLDLNKEQVNFP
jgi:hypothetical protein